MAGLPSHRRSYPRKFYGSLLEDIATKCEAVVVATPIPVVLPGKGLVRQLEYWMTDEGGDRRDSGESTNPLDHLSLAETIQKEFNIVYRDVLLDEYCPEYVHDQEVEAFMKEVPIVGMGHSLGARIQAISCSHPRVSKRCMSMGKGSRLLRSGREGMVYLGFSNWEASSSIPGVGSLGRTVRRRNQRSREKANRGVGRRDDVWEDRSPRRNRRSKRRYRQSEDRDLVDALSDVVSSATRQIEETLTPDSEDLEFSPTPDELWNDLSFSDGWYGQSCRNNLIVQFDADPIDQGSRLARTLLTARDAALNSSKTCDDDDQIQPLHDVKFARLAGGHLAPVTIQESIAKLIPKAAVTLISSSYNFMLQQLDEERLGKSSQKQLREVTDVGDTVASYIKSLCCDEG